MNCAILATAVTDDAHAGTKGWRGDVSGRNISPLRLPCTSELRVSGGPNTLSRALVHTGAIVLNYFLSEGIRRFGFGGVCLGKNVRVSGAAPKLTFKCEEMQIKSKKTKGLTPTNTDDK